MEKNELETINIDNLNLDNVLENNELQKYQIEYFLLGNYHKNKISIPRNGDGFDNISIKIYFTDSIRNIFDISECIKYIKLYVGPNCVDAFTVFTKYTKHIWINDNTIVIPIPLTYSYGIIQFSEHQYLDIVLYVELFDNYSINQTRVLIHHIQNDTII